MTILAMLLQVTAPSPAAPPPPAPPPPVRVAHAGGAAPEERILTYRPTAVQCGGVAIEPTRIEPVIPTRVYGSPTIAPTTVRFRIDASGRPLGITAPSVYSNARSDLMPSLVAWRFAPGAERTDCSVTFYAEPMPLSSVDEATAGRFLTIGGGYGTPAGATLIRRLVPQPSDCVDRWPPLLTMTFPRFDAIPGEPGPITTSIIVYDIDAQGRTENVRVLGDGGNRALDRAGLDAVQEWEYAEGPRRGCAYPYWRASSDVLEAPPPVRDGRPPCPVEPGWANAPPLEFPEPYSRRRIEGWALVAYDVAPWGELGNLRVVQAEPTSEFGNAALNMLRRATKPRSDRGASNCQDMVLFKIAQ